MPWTTEDLKRLVELEAHLQGVDPRLAMAVVSQESEWNPNAVGDNGRSIGLFQLQPAAAKDAGLHPKFRSDVGNNVTAGITYLKQKLKQSGGNVEQALSRYNRGTPDYRGIGDPNYVQNVLRYYPDYQPPAAQKPGMLARVGQALSPSSAEASTGAAPGMTRLQELEAHLARLEGRAAPPASQTAPRTRLEELEAELARRDAQQPPQATTPTAQPTAPQTAPAPAPDPTATPGMRFQALPSITQLEPADRLQKTRDFERLKPALQEEFLRSEEPTAGGLAMGGGPVAQSQPVTDPAALLAIGGRPQAPSTAKDQQTRIREELAQWEKGAGRPWREGDPLMPSQKKLGAPDEAPVTEGITAPSTMIPLLMPGAGIKAVAPLLSKAGPLITRGARAAAEGLSQTAGWTAGRTAETGEVPSPGEIGTEAALNVGTGGVIEGLGAARRGAIRRSQGGRAVQQEGQAHVPEAYSQAVEGQRSAIQTARAVPGRYAPETPSWTLYERFNDVAKHQDVDLLTAKTALADVRAGRGVLPDGSLRPFPQSVERIAASLEQAADTANVQTIQQELRRLGPLIRHADGNIRGPAKQLYGIYADALESSPAANDLLRNANATFRKEMALQDVDEWLRPGHGVIRIDNQGREVINVGSLLTRLEKKIGDDTLFARSFGPDDLQALRQDFGRLAGTPSMPRGGPPVPRSAREQIGERPRFLPTGKSVSATGGLEFLATSLGVPPGVVSGVKAATAVGQQARYALAYALTSERLRPLVMRAIQENGTINPRVYGLIIAAMSPAEKKALERQTRGERR